VAAVLAGGVGAVFYMNQQSASRTAPAAVATPEPASPTTAAPTGELPPVAPAAPEKVTISFSSVPSGAVVSVKDSGEVLGTTPFDKDMPSSVSPLSVVFKKPGYEEAEQPLVARASGPLNASLRPMPPPAEVTEAPTARTRPGKAGGRKSSSASQNGTRKPGNTGRPRDGAQPGTGDDVLMPDFLKNK
jgi:hypothetical protein